MDECNILPPIFRELAEKADRLGNIDREMILEYSCTLNDDQSFLPEIFSIVGPENFGLLVRNFGGQSIRIPKPEDILMAVKNHEE